MERADIFRYIEVERLRQAEKHAGVTLADDITPHAKLVVIMEELGEVARALLDGESLNMQKELIEVAACCVAWLESL